MKSDVSSYSRIEESSNKKNKNQFSNTSDLEFFQSAASSVGRVVHDTYSWQGTGFMISEQLFITNKHIIFDAPHARNFFVEFSYELDEKKNPKPATAFRLSPETLFISSLDYKLDFTIVAIGSRMFGQGKLDNFGNCRLSYKDKTANFGSAKIVHHPRGDYKKITRLSHQIAAIGIDVLQYYADTDVGSSGAPVFDNQWELIALHHWGAPTRVAYTANGQIGPKDTKEGVRISAIIKEINLKRGSLSQKQRSLLENALVL